MAEVEVIEPKDATGLRNNISEVLDLVRRKELDCIVIVYRRNDLSTSVYWNGDNLDCLGLCHLAGGDIEKQFTTTSSKNYEGLPSKDD